MRRYIIALAVVAALCAHGLARASGLKISTDVPGNLFYIGQPVELKIEADTAEPSPAKGGSLVVEWEITDLDGKSVASGSESGTSIKPDVKRVGIYYISCRAKDGAASGKTSFAVIHKIPSLDRSGSAFGLNGGALFHIGLEDIPTVGKARLDLCERLGVKWGRNDFWWGKVEPEHQKYDFRQADATVGMYRDHNISLMPIFCYSSAWSGGKSPADDAEAARFALYAGELVGRYKDNIRYWEVWNEPNISQFWSPDPNARDYARLLKATRSVTLANDPDSKLVGCVTAGADLGFIRKVFEAGAGDSFDVLSIHNYFWADESIVSDIRAVRALQKEFGQEKPIWITEIGWPTGKNWMTEADQAKMLARAFVLALSEGVERIFYYNSTDYQPFDSGGWDGRTGLFDVGDVPKAAAVAYNELIWQLDGLKYGGKLNLGKDVYGRYFGGPHEQTAVIWTTSEKPVTVELPCDIPEALVVDMLGGEKWVKAEKGILRIRATDRPQYVRMRGTALFVLAATDITPERLFIGMEQDVVVTMRGQAIFHGDSVALEVPEGWRASKGIRADSAGNLGERVYRFRVRVPETAEPGVYEIAAVLRRASVLRVAKGVEVATPVKVSITPPSELRAGIVKLDVTVENRCDRVVEGKVSAGIEGETPSVASAVRLDPGASRVYALNLPSSENVGERPVVIEARLESALSDVSDALRLDPLVVKRARGRIEIDGRLDDWEGIAPLLTPEGGAHVDQKGKWGGLADHSARAWAAWDSDALYLAVDVTDDRNVFPGDEKVWEADGLQVCIDAANDAVGEGFDERNDFELEIGKIDGIDRIIGFVAPQGVDLSEAKVVIMAKPSGGAVYELMLPAKSLGLGSLAEGRLIGLSLLVNDNDGQGRKSWVELTEGIGMGKDPSKYKDLRLR